MSIKRTVKLAINSSIVLETYVHRFEPPFLWESDWLSVYSHALLPLKSLLNTAVARLTLGSDVKGLSLVAHRRSERQENRANASGLMLS